MQTFFCHNWLWLKRIITKFGQINLLVKNFHMQAWLLRKNSYHSNQRRSIQLCYFCPIEGKLGMFFLHSEKNFYKFGCMVGCHGDMVTMAAVSGNLFLYFSKGITSKFHKFLSWYQNFSVRLLKFYGSLGKIPATPLLHNIISLNLVYEFNIYH